MFVFPYLRSYLEAGEFTMKGKLSRSLKDNLPYYILYVLIVGATVAVLSSYDLGREALAKQGVTGCLITLNMVVGLLSIIFVLGYGISALPKKLFTLASSEYQFSHNLFNLAQLDCSIILQDANLRNLLAQIDDLITPQDLLPFHTLIQKEALKFK